MNQSTAWINGDFLAFADAKISIADAGFVHGDSVTEMLRTFRGVPFRVPDHFARFRHSLTESLLSCPYSNAELRLFLDKVVSQTKSETDIGIILFATSGPNVTYLGSDIEPTPTIGIHTFPLHFELWRNSMQFGQKLVVAETTAIPPECLDPTIKIRSRIHWRIADRRIRQAHSGSSAVFADSDGNLTETSSGNLFALLNGELVTPPAELVLNGISRQVVRELAEQCSIPVREEMLPVEKALSADELWTSSTPYCLLPVTSLNQQPIGNGKPGPVFMQILQAWSNLVGLDIAQQILEA